MIAFMLCVMGKELTMLAGRESAFLAHTLYIIINIESCKEVYCLGFTYNISNHGISYEKE